MTAERYDESRRYIPRDADDALTRWCVHNLDGKTTRVGPGYSGNGSAQDDEHPADEEMNNHDAAMIVDKAIRDLCRAWRQPVSAWQAIIAKRWHRAVEHLPGQRPEIDACYQVTVRTIVKAVEEVMGGVRQ